MPPGSGLVSGDRQLRSGSAPSLLLHLGQVTPVSGLPSVSSLCTVFPHLYTGMTLTLAPVGMCARGPRHPCERSAQCPACCFFPATIPYLYRASSQCSFGGQLNEIMYRKCLTQYLAHRPLQTLYGCDHSGYFHFFISGLIQLEVLRCPLEVCLSGPSSLPARRLCPIPPCPVPSLSSPAKPRLASVS